MKNKEITKADEEALFQAVSALKNADEARAFFGDLCTPAELEALIDRWRVVHLLIDKNPYRKIAQETGVSVTTVGRVAKCLFAKTSGYKVILKRLGILT